MSQVPVGKRHRVPLYASTKPVAHHQIRAGAQFFDEHRGVSEIIAVIGIRHDDEPAARGSDASSQRVAIPFGLNMNYPRSSLFCNLLGTVASSVIRNNNFACN